MRLGAYKRCEVAIVTAMAVQGYAFDTTRMTPSELARFIGVGTKAIFRSINMAEESGLVWRASNGELMLTTTAVNAIREGFRHGFDGKRRQVAGARGQARNGIRSNKRLVRHAED